MIRCSRSSSSSQVAPLLTITWVRVFIRHVRGWGRYFELVLETVKCVKVEEKEFQKKREKRVHGCQSFNIHDAKAHITGQEALLRSYSFNSDDEITLQSVWTGIIEIASQSPLLDSVDISVLPAAQPIPELQDCLLNTNNKY